MTLGNRREPKLTHEAELAARSEALRVAQSRLDQLAGKSRASPEMLARLKARHTLSHRAVAKRSGGRHEATSIAAELRAELISAARSTSINCYAIAGSPMRRAAALNVSSTWRRRASPAKKTAAWNSHSKARAFPSMQSRAIPSCSQPAEKRHAHSSRL